MSKIVKESLNENLSSDNPWIQQFIEENGLQSGMEDIDLDDLAYFIDQNWGEITGLDNSEKDDEGYFPGEVEEIIDELGLDMDEFSEAWASVREGADDWEDEDEDEDEPSEYADDDMYSAENDMNIVVPCYLCKTLTKLGTMYDYDDPKTGKEKAICKSCAKKEGYFNKL